MAEGRLSRFIDRRREIVETQIINALESLPGPAGEYDISRAVRRSHRPWTTIRFLMGDAPFFMGLDRLNAKGKVRSHIEPDSKGKHSRTLYELNKKA